MQQMRAPGPGRVQDRRAPVFLPAPPHPLPGPIFQFMNQSKIAVLHSGMCV